jgi:hypothetical protein
MKQLKRHQVHRLPTEDRASKIWFDNDTDKFLYDPVGVMNCTPQHLYFTTDEEIKVGDKVYHSELRIVGTVENFIEENDYSKYWTVDGKRLAGVKLRKIIATTDPKLTLRQYSKFGSCCKSQKDCHCQLPQPSQDFIKAYCEQRGIDEVDVEMEEEGRFAYEGDTKYTVKVDPIHNTITTHRIVKKM